jgi:DNA-directed RNA polymerase subunit RPC12/RpoP
MAASPRAKNDLAFREQLIAYFAECAVVKDLDPQQGPLEARMNALTVALQRVPIPGGAWRVAGPFWEYAALWKQQMELAYALLQQTGVLALDPDHAPEGVPLRMEYSTFCQAWLPHLSPEDGERLLKFYGLAAEYDEGTVRQTDSHLCGACGSEIHSLPNAKQVLCGFCGFKIDVGSQAVPCGKCGALLSFPVSTNHVICPYCSTDTRRV